MKQSFTIVFSYFIYLGIVFFVHPASNFVGSSTASIQHEQKQKVPVAQSQTEILHSELLFKF